MILMQATLSSRWFVAATSPTNNTYKVPLSALKDHLSGLCVKFSTLQTPMQSASKNKFVTSG